MDFQVNRDHVASLLIVVATTVAGLAAWAKHERDRAHPYRVALEEARREIDRPTQKFDPARSPEEKPCALKLARIDLHWDVVHDEHSYALRTAAVSRDGDLIRASIGPEYKILDEHGSLPAEALAAIAAELSRPTPPDDFVPLGDTTVFLVGFPEKGGWTTRTYLEFRLPTFVKRLKEIVRLESNEGLPHYAPRTP